MQDTDRTINLDTLWPSPFAASAPWPATKLRPLLPSSATMDIDGLLNGRNGAATEEELEEQLQQSMHLNGNQLNATSYSLNHRQQAPQTLAQQHRPPQIHTSVMPGSGIASHNIPVQHMLKQTIPNHTINNGGMPDPNMSNHTMPYHAMQASPGSQIYASSYDARDQNDIDSMDDDFGAMRQKADGPGAKAFACSTCKKGFARRSDLARHERIHSGVRPHACDYEGCGKRFIQRSALTVHQRVHTGVKPHMCERCKKPFSDSSSLARHRRIHSGKRPYQCPYADCQKTFTRRTTLTRHQNHHTGSLEKTKTDTDAKFSAASSVSSRPSTASPADRTISVSPGHELPPLIGMQRSASDYSYMPQNPSLPPHMRHDYQQQISPRSTPSISGTSLANYTSNPQSRPSPTSHPNSYGPPQPLEPPANGMASGSASPSMVPASWSPHPDSPGSLNTFSYPDPGFGGSSLYFGTNGIRRPQSTEPEDFALRPRQNHHNQLHHSNPLHHNMQMTHDWNHLSTQLPNAKHERYEPIGMLHQDLKQY